MPFKHIVHTEKNIVFLKAKGEVTVMDIVSEIKAAINTKRGSGIRRRLIDVTEQSFKYELEDVQKILKMMHESADILGARKIAILFKKIPDDLKSEKLKSLLNTPTLVIEFFTDKGKAAEFLSEPLKK